MTRPPPHRLACLRVFAVLLLLRNPLPRNLERPSGLDEYFREPLVDFEKHLLVLGDGRSFEGARSLAVFDLRAHDLRVEPIADPPGEGPERLVVRQLHGRVVDCAGEALVLAGEDARPKRDQRGRLL